MFDIWHHPMLNLYQSVFGTPEIKAPRYDEQVLDWATEKLVDGTDSRLRLVSGYKRKLRDCVERSVTFVDDTVENLPPPLAVDPRAFTTDGQVRAWFGTIQTLRESFSLSVPVRQFIAEGGDASLGQFFAAMRTSINEKTVLVPQLRGDMIQREVPRTAFSFIDHMVVAPAVSEEALRLEVKERAYMNLVERSLRHLVSIKRHKGELEKQRTLLRSKLRTLEATQLGMQPFAAATPTEPGDVPSLMARLDEIESELGQTAASVETLDQYLLRVIEVMSKPEDQLRITHAAVRVTQMGFVVPDESSEKCEDVEYTKVEARDLGEFAFRLVTFPVKALQPPEKLRPRI